MEFSPFNKVIKLCLQGMDMEEHGNIEEASKLFMQGWELADEDHEKFLAAHYVSRHQKSVAEELNWLRTALTYALKLNDDTVKSALPSLYQRISNCYHNLGRFDESKEYAELAIMLTDSPADKGPFYHGTRADLKVGDLLMAGGNSNYKSEFRMNHIYFTGLVNGAGLAAELAKGEGHPHIYIIEPTGSYENDPNLTDQKFPGNPTRSYRSEAPLRIIDEVNEWVRPNPEDLKKFRKKLADNEGEIIN